MTKRRILAVAAGLTAVVLMIGGQSPVSAQQTQVDAEVTQGSLTISAQPTNASLAGGVYNESVASQASGQFGDVTVSDGRGVSLAWTLSAASTDFTGVSDTTKSIALGLANTLDFGAVLTPTVGPSATAGACTVAGASLTAADTAAAIATGQNLLTQLDPTTCTFDSELTLDVPAGTPAQTYRGTVTLTVA